MKLWWQSLNEFERGTYGMLLGVVLWGGMLILGAWLLVSRHTTKQRQCFLPYFPALATQFRASDAAAGGPVAATVGGLSGAGTGAGEQGFCVGLEDGEVCR